MIGFDNVEKEVVELLIRHYGETSSKSSWLKASMNLLKS